MTILPDHVYVATVDYGDAVFASPLLRGDQVTSASELPIIIYEFTDDPAVLAIDALQSQVAVSLNEMQVLESSAEFEKHGMKALGWYEPHTICIFRGIIVTL